MGRPDYLVLCCSCGARRLAELGEQRLRKRIAHHLPLRVPLHRERESRRRLHAERLDQAVGRARFDREVRPEPVDALPVQRIHRDALLPGELRAAASRARAPRRAPARTARRAAAPCPRDDRRVPRPRARAGAACRPTRRSFPGSRGTRRTPARRRRWRAESATAWSRRDADRAACRARSPARRSARARHSTDCREEDAVDARQDLGDVERRLEHRDQQRQAVGRLHDRGDVFLADGMKWMRTDHASIGGNANDGSSA